MNTLRRHASTLLYAGLAALLANFHYFQMQAARNAHKRLPRHDAILDLVGESPWAYRLLTPWLAERLAWAQQWGGVAREQAVEHGYLAIHFFALLATFAVAHRVYTAWLGAERALTGVLLLAALHGPSFTFYWFQQDSPLDLLVWVAAIGLTIEGRAAWLFPLVALGTLNRETAVFAIALHAALVWGQAPIGALVARCGGLLVVWGAVFFGLRVAVPTTGEALEEGPIANLLNNVQQPDWWLYAVCFLGGLPVLAAAGWAAAPAPARRVAVVLVPYLALVLVFGRVREVRLLLPAALVLIPLALSALDGKLRTSASSEDAPKRG